MKSLVRTLILTVAVVICAAPAQAREYVVHSCKLPNGQPAATDGWSTNGAAPYMWFDDACAYGGGLTAGLAGVVQPVNTSTIGWGFSSGAATIRGYSINRSGGMRGWVPGASMLIYSSDLENSSASGHQIDYCAAYRGCLSVAGRLTRGASEIPVGSRNWFFSIVCGGNWGDQCNRVAGANDFGSIRIDAASFTLDDPEVPVANSASGTLTQAGAAAGAIRFTASDKISGVRRGVIEVDGVAAASAAPEAAAATCAEVGQSALPDFTLRRPCPSSAQLELTLAPGQLAPGTHTLRVRVYDAAGNAATVFGPQTVTVPPVPPVKTGDPGGVRSTGAVRFVPDRAAKLRANFGERMRVSGVLLAGDGAPLIGAQVTATVRAPAAAIGSRVITVSTDSAGRYRVPIRAASNRTIGLVHPQSGAELSQKLTVHSRVRLAAAGRRVRPLGRMRLTGRIPTERTKRGSGIAIKVKSGRTWRTIGVARTNQRGHFSFSYRFRRTRHASFVFRAVALRSGDLAVTPSPSKPLRIRVG